MLKNEISIEVLFSDIDSMMIAHNAKYYIWFETGRFHFTSDILGFSPREVNPEILLPVTKSYCKYLYPIQLGDTLIEKTYMYIGDTAKIVFLYKLYNNNKECAIGCTEHVMLNESGKTRIQLPKILCDKVDDAKNIYQNCFLDKDTLDNWKKRMLR